MNRLLDDPPLQLEDAEARFSAFLVSNGFPSQIRWITAKDLIVAGDPYHHFVCSQGSDLGRAEANRRYEAGLEAKLGILLQAICATPETTIANVVIPKDSLDAQYRRIRGTLKCSCPTEIIHATIVENPDRWLALAEDFQFRAHVVIRGLDL